MREVILVTFACAALLAAFSILTNVLVSIGLRRRRVAIQPWRIGIPGYLRRLCEQLPPSATNAQLVRIARWSDIAFLVALAVGAITGPFIGQVTT